MSILAITVGGAIIAALSAAWAPPAEADHPSPRNAGPHR